MKPRRMRISALDHRPTASEPTGADAAWIPPARLRSSARPWVNRSLVVVGAAAVALYLVAAIALHWFVDTDMVRAWVAPRASAALNRTVTIERARVGLFPRPSLLLSDITVDNLSGFEGPTLARLDRVRLDVAWLPLLIGRVNVHRVRLDGAMVYLAVDTNGVSNFGDLVPRPADGDSVAKAPFAASVSRVSVSDVGLTFFDAPRQRSFAITGGRGDAIVSDAAEGGWRADMELDSDSLHVRVATVSEEILRIKGPTAELSARSNGAVSGILVDRGFVELLGDTLALRGHVAGFADARPSYDLQLTNSAMDADALRAAFPADLRSRLLPRAEGTLAVMVQIRGGVRQDNRPVLRGSVRLADVTLRLRGEIVAERVGGVVAVDSTMFALDSISGSLAGGPFTLSGSITRGDGATLAVLTRARPDLDALDRLGLLPTGMILSGNADLDLALTGPVRALDSVLVDGTATLEGVQLKHARLGAPLYVPSGVVTLSGRDASWPDLTVLVGSDGVTTSGRLENALGLWSDEDVTPWLEARVAGPRLDLDSIFLPDSVESQASYSQIALAHLGAREVDGRGASALASELGLTRPPDIPVHGSVVLQLDTLVRGRHRLDSVAVRFELTDSALAVSDASFGAWGGRATASLWMRVGDTAEQPFALALSLDDASAGPFFAQMTPAGDAISGTLDMDLEATGSTNPQMLPVGIGLAGRARFAIADGHLVGTGLNSALADFLEAETWSDIPFTSWVTDLEIRENVMEVREAELTGELARIVFSGLLDFAGSTTLSLALSVPPGQLDAVSLRRTGIGPSVVAQLRDSGMPLDLGLHVSGSLAAPTLELDATNATALAGR